MHENNRNTLDELSFTDRQLHKRIHGDTKMRRYKGLILDVDGLMFDTETMYIEQMDHLMSTRGIHMSNAQLEKLIGLDARSYADIEEQYPVFKECIYEFAHFKQQIFQSMFPEKGAGDKPGLKELAEFLNEQQIPYCLASGSWTKDIQFYLSRSLAPLHPSLILSTLDEQIPGKPDPKIFLLAAERMGKEPKDLLVAEDGLYGIRAAYDAGFPSVFIEDHVHLDAEIRQKASYIFENLNCLIPLLQTEES